MSCSLYFMYGIGMIRANIHFLLSKSAENKHCVTGNTSKVSVLDIS